MTRRDVIMMSAFGALTLVMLPAGAIGQQKSPKEQLVGTWTLVSSDTVGSNGARTPTFGAAARGVVVFAPGGRYTMIFANTNFPKFSSNNRTSGPAAENKAVVQGTLGHV